MNREIFPFSIYPDRSRLYSAEQQFTLIIEAGEGSFLPEELSLSIFSLEQKIGHEQLSIPPNSSSCELPFSMNTLKLQTTGVGIELSDGSFTATTAIDIGEGPVRYGFLSDFAPGKRGKRDHMVRKNLLRNHITHTQFYDWAFRPHQFSPGHVESVYRDTMGKEIDLSRVQELVRLLQGCGIKCLAYGAVYAAGEEYALEHAEEALFDAHGRLFDLIGKFFIMNLQNDLWRQRILAQYRYAVNEVGFDGIHMDTYGYPKVVWGYGDVSAHSLEGPFVDFINRWAADCGTTNNIFNNVGGWPAEATALAEQAACYIEVWDPHTRYRHLRNLVRAAAQYGKPVVLAAYLLPFRQRDEHTIPAGREPLAAAQLLTATVSTFGATSLLLGEETAILTQPYYSDYTNLSPEEQESLRMYYDFQVRYRDLFYCPDLVDITESHLLGENGEFRITAEHFPVSWEGAAGSLWVTLRKSEERMVISLINLTEQDDDLWNSGKVPVSHPLSVTLQVPMYWKDLAFYTACPEYPASRKLPAAPAAGLRGPAVEITLEMQGFWQIINIQQCMVSHLDR